MKIEIVFWLSLLFNSCLCGLALSVLRKIVKKDCLAVIFVNG